MTAPITYGGTLVGNAKNVAFPFQANPFGIDRILCAGIGINANSASTDYTLTLGALALFSSGTTGTTLVVPTVFPYPQNWIAGSNFMITRIIYNNASISLTTATAGVFTATAAGGTTIVTSAALSALTAAANGLQSVPALAANALLNYYTLTNMYFRIGTAQGAAATLDVYVMGVVFP